MISIPIPIDNSIFQKVDSADSLTSYLQDAADLAFYDYKGLRPKCPFCSSCLYSHGTCTRPVCFWDSPFNIIIHRVYCPHCGKSHRVLPSFIVPRFKMCSDDASKIIVSYKVNNAIFSDIASGISQSSAYHFLHKMKSLYGSILNQISSFQDLFKHASSYFNEYFLLSPPFSSFHIFQPSKRGSSLQNLTVFPYTRRYKEDL